MYDNIRKKRYTDAIFDQGLWLLTVFGIVLFGLSSTSAISPGLDTPAQYLALTGVLGLVLTQGRREKNIIKRLLIGAVSLYGLVGYMSDTLSYSRLLALGMATGVIALIVNELAKMAFQVPLVGIGVGIMVLLCGHAFNLVISTLSAYIHTSRLQYVEFFGKFFEGGGKRFKPFGIYPEYIKEV